VFQLNISNGVAPVLLLAPALTFYV